MKLNFLFIVLLFSSCTHTKISGYVRDFDNNKPVSNVLISINNSKTQTDSLGYFSLNVNSNSSCVLKLKKEGYAVKQIIRKPYALENKKNDKADKNTIYMFKNESDFSNKKNQ